MNILIDKTFAKDISRIKDKKVLQNIKHLISILESSESLSEIPNTKKIKGYKEFFRIRVGEYRLGIEKYGDETLCLIRLLHRKDIYKYFPQK
ncbi:MAG: type II toxin-antitoxin system RelE/ParE family toxin [Melioribacteraceae bacterium]|nr:MAG: type II toxin-antitoxin system RelE/ParE family toxin [Melioribacteraceae bacterium]